MTSRQQAERSTNLGASYQNKRSALLLETDRTSFSTAPPHLDTPEPVRVLFDTTSTSARPMDAFSAG